MLTSTLQVARNTSVRIPFFRAVVADGNESPQTGWAPSTVYVRKSGVGAYAKSLTAGVNFFEVDAVNMKGLYEILLDASDVDTLGYVTITDGGASSVSVEVVERTNTLVASALSVAQTDLQTVQADVTTSQTNVGFATTDDASATRVLAGKWKVDSATNVLTVYDADNTTPLVSLSLANAAGAGTTNKPTQAVSSDPALFSLSATSGFRWFASRTLTITGKNLPSGCTVTFGSTSGIVPSASSATSITFTFPESELDEVGARTVRVVPPSGPQPNALTYTVVKPAFQFAGYSGDSVVLNGANVSSWTDYTGSGRHISQSTAAQQPPRTASNNAFNGRGSVDFTGLSYRLMSNFDVTLADKYTCFAVCRSTSNTGGWAFRQTSPTNGAGLGFATTRQAQMTVFRGTSSTSAGAIAVALPKPLVPVSLIGSFSYPNNSVIDSAKVTTESVTTFPATLSGISIGNAPTTLNQGNIQLAEMCFFSQALTDAQKDSLHRYAARKYKARTVTWQAKAALPQSRGWHSIGKLPDGRVAVFGGVTDATGSSPTNLTSLLLYNVATDQWTACAATPAQLGSAFVGGKDLAVMADGRIFVQGTTTSAGIYNPANDTWSVLATPVAFTKNTVLALPDNRVMVVGPQTNYSTGQTGGNVSGWIYNPDTGAFFLCGDGVNGTGFYLDPGTGAGDTGPAALVLADGRVAALSEGGIWLYNPADDTGVLYLVSPAPNTPMSLRSNGEVILGHGTSYWSSTAPTASWQSRTFAQGTPAVSVDVKRVTNLPMFADGTLLLQSGDCVDFDLGAIYRVRTAPSIPTGGRGITLNDGRILWTGGRVINLGTYVGFQTDASVSLYEKW